MSQSQATGRHEHYYNRRTIARIFSRGYVQRGFSLLPRCLVFGRCAALMVHRVRVGLSLEPADKRGGNDELRLQLRPKEGGVLDT